MTRVPWNDRVFKEAYFKTQMAPGTWTHRTMLSMMEN